jgi:hypothetical protein
MQQNHVGCPAVKQSRSFRTRTTTYFRNAKPEVFVADSSREDIEREIRAAVEVQGTEELRLKGREFTEEVVDYAKIISPFDVDDSNVNHYRDSWIIRARNARGKLPSWTIRNVDPIARIVESGSYARPQGGDSPAHETMASTAARFGGTVDGIGGSEDDDL